MRIYCIFSQGTVAAHMHTKYPSCLDTLLDNPCSLCNTDTTFCQVVTAFQQHETDVPVSTNSPMDLDIWILSLYMVYVKRVKHAKNGTPNHCLKQWVFVCDPSKGNHAGITHLSLFTDCEKSCIMPLSCGSRERCVKSGKCPQVVSQRHTVFININSG